MRKCIKYSTININHLSLKLFSTVVSVNEMFNEGHNCDQQILIIIIRAHT